MLWQAQSIRTGKEDSKFHLFIFIHSNKRHWHFVVVSSSGETQIQKTQKNISAKSQLILYWPLQVWTLMVIRFILFYFILCFCTILSFFRVYLIFMHLLLNILKGGRSCFQQKKHLRLPPLQNYFFALK